MTSVAAASEDAAFVEALYDTLRAWGVGSRGSILVPLAEFGPRLRSVSATLEPLEPLRIDADDPNIQSSIESLWKAIESMRVVRNKAPLVAGTKTLHHLLPDLVPPMDRAYTQTFFGWHAPQFQNDQARCFGLAYKTLASVARRVRAAKHVETHRWHSSVSTTSRAGYTIVKAYVREQKLGGQEMFVPLAHPFVPLCPALSRIPRLLVARRRRDPAESPVQAVGHGHRWARHGQRKRHAFLADRVQDVSVHVVWCFNPRLRHAVERRNGHGGWLRAYAAQWRQRRRNPHESIYLAADLDRAVTQHESFVTASVARVHEATPVTLLPVVEAARVLYRLVNGGIGEWVKGTRTDAGVNWRMAGADLAAERDVVHVGGEQFGVWSCVPHPSHFVPPSLASQDFWSLRMKVRAGALLPADQRPARAGVDGADLEQGLRGMGTRARRRDHGGGAHRPAAAPLPHRQHPGQQLPDAGASALAQDSVGRTA